MWQASQRWAAQVHWNSNDAICPPPPLAGHGAIGLHLSLLDFFYLAFVQLFLMFPSPTLCAGNVYSGHCTWEVCNRFYF